MMSFWILAAGLLGIALLFALTPLFRRDSSDHGVRSDDLNLEVFKQQLEELDADLAAGNLDQPQYDASKRDLEKELLSGVSGEQAGPERSGRWAAGVVGLALPAFAIALYIAIGDYSAVDKANAAPAVAQQGEHSGNMPSMDVLVEKLEQRLQSDPSAEGWVMLGRSYLALGNNAKAMQAYENALELAPEDTDTLLGYAEALAKTQGGLQGKAAELIARALELQPDNPNALWMNGLLAYQQGDSGRAIGHWEKLQGMLQAGSEDAQMLAGYIDEARQEAGLGAAPAQAPKMAEAENTAPAAAATTTQAASTAAATDSGASVQVEVRLAEGFAGKFAPQDTLFVFARALNGPPMPLAVQRLQAKDLPVSLTLDDSMAMMPQMRLSSFPEVVVGARISKSGNAIPQTGDLQGEIKPVRPGQKEVVSVVIDTIRP
jgi:cytochrome c-type biogenesis protein CcmH